MQCSAVECSEIQNSVVQCITAQSNVLWGNRAIGQWGEEGVEVKVSYSVWTPRYHCPNVTVNNGVIYLYSVNWVK